MIPRPRPAYDLEPGDRWPMAATASVPARLLVDLYDGGAGPAFPIDGDLTATYNHELNGETPC